MTPQLQLLKAMRSLLAKPESWYKGYFAADSLGNYVESSSPAACKFCLVGALSRVSTPNLDFQGPAVFDPISDAVVELYPDHPAITETWGRRSVSGPAFNDHPSTTHEMVLAVLDRAIENLTKE